MLGQATANLRIILGDDLISSSELLTHVRSLWMYLGRAASTRDGRGGYHYSRKLSLLTRIREDSHRAVGSGARWASRYPSPAGLSDPEQSGGPRRQSGQPIKRRVLWRYGIRTRVYSPPRATCFASVIYVSLSQQSGTRDSNPLPVQIPSPQS